MGIEKWEPKIEPQEDKSKTEQPKDKSTDNKQNLNQPPPFVIIRVSDEDCFLI